MRAYNSNSVKVGWLLEGQGFPTGNVDPAFIERLWALCTCSINQTRGFHNCPFCNRPAAQGPLAVRRNGVTLRLGSAEIRVFSPDGTIYGSPNLIFHYVNDHSYLPPSDFVQAVLAGPIPPAPDYFRRLQESGFEHTDCLGMKDPEIEIKEILAARKRRKPKNES